MSEYTLRPVAVMRSDFPAKFGIPRQAGVVKELEGLVVFLGDFAVPEALRGIEQFSHIWLIWQFSENLRQDWSPTVRPPRLGGNVRMGVFATRSPFRPNALGLSCVRLLGVERTETGATALRVAGADLMDGTPIFDVKPYIPYADRVEDASCGFAPDPGETLRVEFSPEALKAVAPEKLAALRGVLENDPRPRYQDEGQRIYGLEFSGMEIKFSVEGRRLLVSEALPIANRNKRGGGKE